MWEQVQIQEDSPEEAAVYAEFIDWEPPATRPPVTSHTQLEAVQDEFNRKYNVYFTVQQRYNAAVIELEGLAASEAEAERAGNRRAADHYRRELWLAGASKVVLMRTWRKVRDALARDLDSLRAVAEAYVTRARRSSQNGTGRTVAVN